MLSGLKTKLLNLLDGNGFDCGHLSSPAPAGLPGLGG